MECAGAFSTYRELIIVNEILLPILFYESAEALSKKVFDLE